MRARRVSDKSLGEGTRSLLQELRRDLGPYGWTIHVEGFPGHQLGVVFRNRLSSVSHGFGFDPDQTRAELSAELHSHLEEEPEFARSKLAKPPRRKRELVGGLRWAATTYGWSRRVFGEIIDTLQAAGVLYGDEAEWMRIVGPTALQEKFASQWRKQVRAEQRRQRGKSLVSDESATGGSARESTRLEQRPRNHRRSAR